MRNARFWVWWNDGWVKLSLQPQESVAVYNGGRTEEGWYRSWTTWYRNDGDIVFRRCESEECDCDGRLDHWDLASCPLDNLKLLTPFDQSDIDAGIMVPDWTRVVGGQRDHEAERAGY